MAMPSVHTFLREWLLEQQQRDERVLHGDLQLQHRRPGHDVRGNPFQISCVACFDVLSHQDAHRGQCGHQWCRTCLVNRYESAANSTHLFPAQCCNVPILPDNHAPINPETWARYFEKKEEVETPNPTYCSKRECSRFISLQNINEGQARCICGHITCADCKAEWHTGKCVVDASTEHFLNLARREHWQRCVQCRAMIERIDGCNEISMCNTSCQRGGLCFEASTNEGHHSVQPLRNRVLL